MKEENCMMKRFVIFAFHQIRFYFGEQIKEDEIYSSVCRSWSAILTILVVI
jgi:hypothetical protein